MSWPLELAPYKVQLEALRRAQEARGFGYWMDLGTGKTAVILAEFTNLNRAALVDDLVVVCPNSLKQNWQDEADKFGAKFGSVSLWPEDFPTAKPHLLVMNYEALSAEKGTLALQRHLKASRVMLVLDESIHIKNPRARRTRHILALAPRAQYVRVLSGAPVTQGPHDLWAQVAAIGAAPMNFYAWREQFCKLGGYLGKQVMGVKDLDGLNRILDPCSFRASKEDWLDLPKKIYTTRTVTMTADQQYHYDRMLRDFVTTVQSKTVTAEMVVTQLTKLQQISSNFIIDAAGTAHRISATNPKMEVVKEILESVSGKTLIFTYYRHSTETLAQELQAPYIWGGMDKVGISEMKRQFEQEPNIRVLVAQVHTARYGHTLLGGEGPDRCATTIFYENSYSLDARTQSENRNHRIGQDRSVTYLDLIASRVDRAVIRALQRKNNVATAILDHLKDQS